MLRIVVVSLPSVERERWISREGREEGVKLFAEDEKKGEDELVDI